MKRISTIIISLLLVAASLLTMASCSGMTAKNTETEEEFVNIEPTSETVVADKFEIKTLSASNMVMLSAGPTVAKVTTLASTLNDEDDGNIPTPRLLGAGANYLEKTLMATVLPADAPNKAVDWSVAWADDASRKTQSISNYVTVTPTSDGSNTATVKCFQGFEGDIIVITVTTRVGGFKATCQATYSGAPTSIGISTSGKTVKTDTAWNLSMVEVSSGTTEQFDITKDNLLHAVGSSYNDYSISIESFGGINVSNRVHSNTTGADSYSTSTVNMTASNLFESDGYCYASFSCGGGLLSVIKVTIENGKLVVQGQSAISSYYSMSAGRGGYNEGTFSSFIDGKTPYVKITLTEKTSGVSTTVNIKPVASVNSVALNNASISF